MRVIKAAQRQGFTLDEVADVLAANRLGGRADAGLQARATANLAEVDKKLADLMHVRHTLLQWTPAAMTCSPAPKIPTAQCL